MRLPALLVSLLLIASCASAQERKTNTTSIGNTEAEAEGADNPSKSITKGVKVGLDNLLLNGAAELKNKKLGLIVNQTSRTSDDRFGPDALIEDKRFNVQALFSPEHGLFGERQAGVTSDSAYTYKGIPVQSLYGSARKPSQKMLVGLEVLVFDIQDIGVRPYTYVSTMILAMEAAAERGIPFVVLDRPNPLGGERIEGNVLELPLKSFVGQVAVPYVHGMTLGEIATMAVARKWFNASESLKLTVIRLTGWKRSMTWPETGLMWTAPSPNIPRPESAVGAAMLGATGELGFISIGIGTDDPFLRIGSSLAGGTLEATAKNTMPKGVSVKREDFSSASSGAMKTYEGIHLSIPTDYDVAANLYTGQFKLLHELLKRPVIKQAFEARPESNVQMFHKVVGTRELYDSLKAGRDLTPLFNKWEKEAASFRQQRQSYLLYD